MILATPHIDRSTPLNAATFRPELSQVPSEDLSKLVQPVELVTRRERLTRIFQIGFNKCGTRSLYRFLQRSGIPAAHFGKGGLAVGMKHNIDSGRKPLAGKIDNYVGYTDVQQVTRDYVIEGVRFFRQLYEYYPESYFILNTRDKEGWIRSRLRHGAGHYAKRYARALKLEDETQVVAAWGEEWDRHHAEVVDFFADKPGRLLVYDIKTSQPAEMVQFLAPDFLTRVEDFRHEGDTEKVDADYYKGNKPGVLLVDGEIKERKRRGKKKDRKRKKAKD